MQLPNLKQHGLLLFVSVICLAFKVQSQTLNQIDESCEMVPKLIPINVKGKFGYCSKDKKLVIQPIFDDAEPFLSINYSDRKLRSTSKNFATVMIDSIFFRINVKGEIVDTIDSKKILDDDFSFQYQNPNFGIFKQDSLVGVKNIVTDKIIIPAIYNAVYPFEPNLVLGMPYITKKSNKYGLVEQNGKVIYEPQFEMILGAQEYYYNLVRLLKVKKNKMVFYTDLCGNEFYIR